METYLFHRMHNGKMHFYPANYKNDDEAAKGAEGNPGTTYVTRAKTGEIIWPKIGTKQ